MVDLAKQPHEVAALFAFAALFDRQVFAKGVSPILADGRIAVAGDQTEFAAAKSEQVLQSRFYPVPHRGFDFEAQPRSKRRAYVDGLQAFLTNQIPQYVASLRVIRIGELAADLRKRRPEERVDALAFAELRKRFRQKQITRYPVECAVVEAEMPVA